MHTIRKLCALLAVLLLAATPALAASVTVVTNQATEVHQSASSGSVSVSVANGLEMKLVGYHSGWGKVNLKGRTGYVQMKYLDLKKSVTAYLSKDAKLYAQADSEALGTLNRGTKVSFLGVDGDYARVSANGGKQKGYVLLSALTSKKPGASTKADEVDARTAKIDRVLATAQNLLGKPYSLKSNPPHSFNCAAFVYYCFDAAESGCVGKKLNEQVHDSSHAKVKSISALKRGDVVCFNFDDKNDKTGHVGIYIGDGWFVHASASDGMVTVSKLTSGYYKRSFSWGRRIFKD